MALAARMSQAMEDVIEDSSVDTVAGFPIHVKGDERGFRYLLRAAQFGGFTQSAPAGVETPLQFGKPSWAGGYGYTYCVPEPGEGVVGVYFPQDNLGALFHPLVSDNVIKYLKVTHEQFVAAVESEYSIRLSGIGFQ